MAVFHAERSEVCTNCACDLDEVEFFDGAHVCLPCKKYLEDSEQLIIEAQKAFEEKEQKKQQEAEEQAWRNGERLSAAEVGAGLAIVVILILGVLRMGL